MRIICNLMFVVLISLLLVSCSTLPSTFSTENIMMLHQGMSSDEILALFGEPHSISVSICGRAPNQWNCTTWEYGEFAYDSASFTFSGEHDSLKLNDFEVEREGSTLPSTFSTENIMKIHQGMSSDEILALFGEPHSIRASVCGKVPNQWNCTTWKYGEFAYGSASFTFSGKHDSLILNNFEVERD